MRILLFLFTLGLLTAVAAGYELDDQDEEFAADASPLYLCKARNLIGRRFTATGPIEAEAQEAAMRKCEAYSFACYPTGCQQIQ